MEFLQILLMKFFKRYLLLEKMRTGNRKMIIIGILERIFRKVENILLLI